MGYPELQLSVSACEMLTVYDWPGNVRELKNIMERAVVLSQGGKINEEHLPQEFFSTPHSPKTLLAPKKGKAANRV
jgi:DNA-binding NtrC family response regulator